MWTSFLQGLGAKLAERWLVAVLTPAFGFWGIGLVALLCHDDKSLQGWGLASLIPAHSHVLHVPFPQDLRGLSTERQIAFLVGGLLVVGISAAIAQRFLVPTLRLAEGYGWPSWLDFFRMKLVRRKAEAVEHATVQRDTLLKKDFDAMTIDQRRDLALLYQLLRRSPSKDRVLPTKLGNVMRAAEDLPEKKYGLNALVCWPRLWLLLPNDAKKELTGSRAPLNAAALAFLWCLSFLVWSIWAWWAAPLGLLAAFLAYRSMVMAAVIYGELIESTFDVHRIVLYKALRWPLPKNPSLEREVGEQITEYLYHGSIQSTPIFTEDSSEES